MKLKGILRKQKKQTDTEKKLEQAGYDPEKIPMNKQKTIGQQGKAQFWIQTILIVGTIAMIFSAYVLIQEAYKVPDDATADQQQKAQNSRNLGILVLLLLGSVGFAPIGIFLGWIVADPYQRARAKRWMMKKNYGIVNFVSRGGKILSKIKDFDTDLIFVNDGVWILEPDRVYKLVKSEQGTDIEASNPIKEKHIQNIMGIPVLFLSIDTMRPLSFETQQGDANPIDLASTLKGYIMNQLAKNMFFKRTFTAIGMITIVLVAVTMYFCYMNYQTLQDLDKILPALNKLAENSDKIIKAGTTVINQGGGG